MGRIHITLEIRQNRRAISWIWPTYQFIHFHRVEGRRKGHDTSSIPATKVTSDDCVLRLPYLCIQLSCNFTPFVSYSNLLLTYLKDGYFLPFYFQAVQGASASESGVRFISLAISEMVAIVATGALVTKTGHYVLTDRLLTSESQSLIVLSRCRS